MPIYTRTGDSGDTSLFGAGRIRKDALRLEAVGAIDELNAALGVVRAEIKKVGDGASGGAGIRTLDPVLAKIQHELFAVGADLATPDGPARLRLSFVSGRDVLFLEKCIDRLSRDLAPLRAFILPGGSLAAAQIHFARTVCRSAERVLVAFSRREALLNPELLKYINRLSDALFVMARWVNHTAGEPEVQWIQRNEKG